MTEGTSIARPKRASYRKGVIIKPPGSDLIKSPASDLYVYLGRMPPGGKMPRMLVDEYGAPLVINLNVFLRKIFIESDITVEQDQLKGLVERLNEIHRMFNRYTDSPGLGIAPCGLVRAMPILPDRYSIADETGLVDEAEIRPVLLEKIKILFEDQLKPYLKKESIENIKTIEDKQARDDAIINLYEDEILPAYMARFAPKPEEYILRLDFSNDRATSRKQGVFYLKMTQGKGTMLYLMDTSSNGMSVEFRGKRSMQEVVMMLERENELDLDFGEPNVLGKNDFRAYMRCEVRRAEEEAKRREEETKRSAVPALRIYTRFNTSVLEEEYDPNPEYESNLYIRHVPLFDINRADQAVIVGFGGMRGNSYRNFLLVSNYPIVKAK